jgi:LysM repeat protein
MSGHIAALLRLGATVVVATGLVAACSSSGGDDLVGLPSTTFASIPTVPSRASDDFLIPISTAAATDAAAATADGSLVPQADGSLGASTVPGILEAPAGATAETTVPATTTTAIVNGIGVKTTYTLESGDTLIKLARVWGITVEDLEAVNQDSGVLDSMIVGERINIPAGASGDAAKIAAGQLPQALPQGDSVVVTSPGQTTVPVTAPNGTPAPPGSITYVIQQGQSLSEIAANRGITLEALLQANSLTPTSLIRVGQTIVLPPTSG